MKILNLYSGIGGNRKLWGDEHSITAIEIKEEIATIYKDFFPKDNVLVCDAHAYLLEHFEEFDFIWSSPPCPTHSKIRLQCAVARGQNKPVYPSMILYEEILLLKHYFKGKWCVENVIAFYEPLIRPTECGGHWFWSNFFIKPISASSREHNSKIDELQKRKGFDLSKYSSLSIEKKAILRNCVEPELGYHILHESQRNLYPELFEAKI